MITVHRKVVERIAEIEPEGTGIASIVIVDTGNKEVCTITEDLLGGIDIVLEPGYGWGGL